jgi:hypothetical protein
LLTRFDLRACGFNSFDAMNRLALRFFDLFAQASRCRFVHFERVFYARDLRA